MKTLSELPGIPLREIYRWAFEFMAEARRGKTWPQPVAAEPEPPEPEAPPATEESSAPPTEAIVETEVTAEAETSTESVVETPAEEPPQPEPSPSEPPVEVAAPEPSVLPEIPKAATEEHIKTFDERVKELEKKRQEEREAQRKEHQALLEKVKVPLTARIKEKFQWSDERIALVFPSLDLIQRDQIERLRRIVLWKPEKEGEPLPKFGQKVGELIYVLEYLPAPETARREDRPRRERGRGKGSSPPRGGPRREEGGGRGPGSPREGKGPAGPAGPGRPFRGPPRERKEGDTRRGRPRGPRPPQVIKRGIPSGGGPKPAT